MQDGVCVNVIQRNVQHFGDGVDDGSEASRHQKDLLAPILQRLDQLGNACSVNTAAVWVTPPHMLTSTLKPNPRLQVSQQQNRKKTLRTAGPTRSSQLHVCKDCSPRCF